MGAGATGMALEGDARLDQVQRLCPSVDNAAGVEGAGAVIDGEEALRMLQRLVIGGHAFGRQQGGKQAVARALADMERLGHGAEIRLDARCHGSGQRQRRRDLLDVELQQLGAGRGGAEGAERRCRVPALLIMMEVHRAAELGLDLHADGVGRQYVAAAGAERFAQRPQGRENRRRRMAADRVAAIVEVERMHRRPVGQCRHRRLRAKAGTDDHAPTAGSLSLDESGDDRAGPRGHAGKTDPEGVGDRPDGLFPRAVGNRVGIAGKDDVGQSRRRACKALRGLGCTDLIRRPAAAALRHRSITTMPSSTVTGYTRTAAWSGSA